MIVENPNPITEDELRRMGKEAKGRIKTIYLHWTSGHYGQVDNLYHLCVDQDGKHDMNDTMLFADISLKRNGYIVI